MAFINKLLAKKNDIISLNAERLNIERSEARLSRETERSRAQTRARESEFERNRVEKEAFTSSNRPVSSRMLVAEPQRKLSGESFDMNKVIATHQVRWYQLYIY